MSNLLGGQQEKMAQLWGPLYLGLPLEQADSFLSQPGPLDSNSQPLVRQKNAGMGGPGILSPKKGHKREIVLAQEGLVLFFNYSCSNKPASEGNFKVLELIGLMV